jgi:hypothetical protein
MQEHGDRYAVVFREQGGHEAAGALELGADTLLLTGGNRERRADLAVPFAQVVDVHIGRDQNERLNRHPTLVVERAHMPTVLVAPLGAGLLTEIADLLIELTERQPEHDDRLTVAVPLRPDCVERARRLLEQGPPVDPATLGLTSHQVYIAEHEALFVFTGPRVRARVRNAMRTPALWKAGLAWRDCIAGQPRIVGSAGLLANEAPAYTWPARQAFQRLNEPAGRAAVTRASSRRA